MWNSLYSRSSSIFPYANTLNSMHLKKPPAPCQIQIAILSGMLWPPNEICLWLCLKHPKITYLGTSLVVQWLRIRLPMQGTRVRALVREDPTCHGATKPASHNYWSPRATTTEARAPRARAPQLEKPPQWEAHAPQRRVAAAHHNYRKPTRSNEDPTQPKINKIKSLKKNNIFEAIFSFCF